MRERRAGPQGAIYGWTPVGIQFRAGRICPIVLDHYHKNAIPYYPETVSKLRLIWEKRRNIDQPVRYRQTQLYKPAENKFAGEWIQPEWALR